MTRLGKVLQIICTKLSPKSSPNILVTFWAISNNVTCCWIVCGYSLGNFGGKLGICYSIIWSHCLRDLSLLLPTLRTVWPIWAIFERSWLQISVQKYNKYLASFRLFVYLKWPFLSKTANFLGNFWRKLGYFLFQHLYTLGKLHTLCLTKKLNFSLFLSSSTLS